jgi:hypothetical protein
MKKSLLFFLFFQSCFVFAQSEKEQIKLLTARVDSLIDEKTIKIKDSILLSLYKKHLYDYDLNEITFRWFQETYPDFNNFSLAENDLMLYNSIDWSKFNNNDTVKLKILIDQTAPYPTSIKALKYLISPIITQKKYDVAFKYVKNYDSILNSNNDFVRLMSDLKRGMVNLDISFFMKKNNDEINSGIPYIVVNGEKQKIADELFCNLELLCQKDFDNNGVIDALFIYDSSCGGNAGGPLLFLTSYDKKRGLIKRNFNISGWFENISIEKSNIGWDLIITSNSTGFGNDKLEIVKEKFRFQNNYLSLITTEKMKKIDALFEVESSMFDNNESITIVKYFDFDNDKILEKLKFTYWIRWGSMIIDKVEFSKSKNQIEFQACKRFGILETETNGVKDIIYDFDNIYKWNGFSYIKND